MPPCPAFLLSRDELPEAASLEAGFFPAPWSCQQFLNGYDQGISHVHGVRIEDALVGYISSQILPPEMEILNIAVARDFQQRGLGRVLGAAALKHGAALGVAACHLEVDEANTAALHLYMSLGFSRVGRRQGYYRHPEGSRDAIVMFCAPRDPARGHYLF